MLAAFRHGFPGARIPPDLPAALADPDSDLADFLRYKISLFLMRLLDPAPLAEAADFLAAHAPLDRPFRLDRLPEVDLRAVRAFRDAEFPFLEGRSDPIVALKRRILQVAPSEMSVLITGETGTGKEAVAYYLHEFSPRRARPFVALNCAGLDEHFLRSELFGHKKGAFTGAVDNRSGLVKLANGGTLFLDEVGETALPIQADLLRFLQTRRFRRLGGTSEQVTDIRLVAATQPGLKRKIDAGAFRRDLFYRLAEVRIRTPALADVPDDVLRVARHYLYRLARDKTLHFDLDEVLNYFGKNRRLLQRHPWPGNVRELTALVKRRALLGDDIARDLEAGPREKVSGTTLFNEACLAPHALRPIDEVVAEYVTGAFAARGALTQKELAERLGRSLNTVKKMLRG